MAQLELLEIVEDIPAIVKVLNGLNNSTLVTIARALINEKDSSLDRNEKLILLFMLTKNYSKNPMAQFNILDLIGQNEELLKEKPLLLVAAQSDLTTAEIPLLIAWAEHYMKNKGEAKTPREIALLVQEALEQSIIENNPEILKKMLENGVAIPNGYASRLLWVVVGQNKNALFIPLLINRGANINFANRGYSLLAKAVDNQNFDLVKEIVAIGGKNLNIDAVHDVQIGSPLQIAIEKKLTEIDAYLRAHGAQEKISMPNKKNKLKN